jgi:hypothetical protein
LYNFLVSKPLGEPADFAEVSLLFLKKADTGDAPERFVFNRIRIDKLKEDLPEPVIYYALKEPTSKEFKDGEISFDMECIHPTPEME